MAMIRAVLFDLDGTLVDTDCLALLRQSRDWRGCVGRASETTVFPGIEDVLRQLRERRIIVGVVTTSVSFYASSILRYHRIAHDTLVAFHDAPPKPLPDPYLLACKKLGCDPSSVLGVGDTQEDMESLRRARIRSLRAGWNEGAHLEGWDGMLSVPADLYLHLGID